MREGKTFLNWEGLSVHGATHEAITGFRQNISVMAADDYSGKSATVPDEIGH